MNQLQKYTWLIDKVRRYGRISHRDLSDLWERDKDMSDYRPLPRATFNRWRATIRDQFGIIIACERAGGYQYYIANPEDIECDELKKWMLDSFAAGNAVSENISLKDRILVEAIPSGHLHLTTILRAMNEGRTVRITYRRFTHEHSRTFEAEPYCVKLFQQRWYVLARDLRFDDLRLYGLDRVEGAELADTRFRLPRDFSAAGHFEPYFGVVHDSEISPCRIVLRAYGETKHYLNSLPLHHSQRIICEADGHADFELFLAPTYDFIMRVLQHGDNLELMKPDRLRSDIADTINRMHRLYSPDNNI